MPHFALMVHRWNVCKPCPLSNIIKEWFPEKKNYCNLFGKVDNLSIKHLTTYPFFLPVYFKTLYTISLCLFGSLISRPTTILSGNYNFFISFLSFQLKDFIYLSNLVHLLHFHCYFLWPNCHILFLEY